MKEKERVQVGKWSGMEKFGEELLDDLFSKQDNIRQANRRLLVKFSEALAASTITVSYTHLTLPTIYSV